jgi:hypothetical protein
MRVNQGQEFVIGGYTPSGRNFDAIIFGYYDDEGRLVYVARTRNGFTPASREAMFKRFRAFWLASNAHISGSRVTRQVTPRASDNYSARKAVMGSILVARTAGILLDTSATRQRAAVTAAKVSGSNGRTP